MFNSYKYIYTLISIWLEHLVIVNSMLLTIPNTTITILSDVQWIEITNWCYIAVDVK